MLSNVIKNGSSKITEKTLEALGFVNVPKGEWAFRSTAKGNTYKKSANTIPLVKNVFKADRYIQNIPKNATDGTTNYYNINGKIAVAAQFKPEAIVTGTVYGQGYNLYLPAFYDNDYTKLQTCTYTDITQWYEKVGG